MKGTVGLKALWKWQIKFPIHFSFLWGVLCALLSYFPTLQCLGTIPLWFSLWCVHKARDLAFFLQWKFWPTGNKFYCESFLYMGKKEATIMNSKMKKNEEGNTSIVFWISQFVLVPGFFVNCVLILNIWNWQGAD